MKKQIQYERQKKKFKYPEVTMKEVVLGPELLNFDDDRQFCYMDSGKQLKYLDPSVQLKCLDPSVNAVYHLFYVDKQGEEGLAKCLLY